MIVMAVVYEKIPIIDVARRCGLVLNSRTLRRQEVEASCPFCGDHGQGKYHLFLNTETDQYYCHLCNASGNSVTLYAKLNGLSNKEAANELLGGNNVYALPRQPICKLAPEKKPADILLRDACYQDMLNHLKLSDEHFKNLLKRGLSEDRISQNQYRSMPKNIDERRLLARILSDFHELNEIPGFYTDKEGFWTLAGAEGMLIPVKDKEGLIQGLQIRLDKESEHKRKYRWLSSRYLKNGTRCHAWVHVVGNREAKTAYLTEGALKGDVASFLSDDDLFISLSGVNATGYLKQVLKEFNLLSIKIAIDMDKLTNEKVQKGLYEICQIIKSAGLHYTVLDWDPLYKGIDDFYLSTREAA